LRGLAELTLAIVLFTNPAHAYFDIASRRLHLPASQVQKHREWISGPIVSRR